MFLDGIFNLRRLCHWQTFARITIVFSCLVVLPAVLLAADIVSSDICIYGGTSGGVIAAVQASRMGKSAVIAEPERHLGGMSSGGLCWTDFGNKTAIGGLAHHFYELIGAHYGKSEEYALEAHVAEQVFSDFVKDSKTPVRFQQRLASVKKDGKRILEIVMEDGTVYRAKMFIDATYEGDLMAKSGVSYVVGREARKQYNESLAGVQEPAKRPNSGKFEVTVDPYLRPGDPHSGLVPLLKDEPLGKEGSEDHRVQSYNYRICLTRNSENKLPLAAPANYNEATYELLARWIEARIAQGEDSKGNKLTAETMSLSDFLKYDPLPNGKFDFNNRWPLSTDYIGGADEYPDANYDRRRKIAKEHEDYLRGFLHFLATSPRVPKHVRDEVSAFGLCKDEFVDNGGWPHQLYVREARRMVGDFVMTERQCIGEPDAANSVGLGAYNIDMHGVRRIVVDGKITNEGSNGRVIRKPYPIAYHSIVPKAVECENLFVPFCLSASHEAFGSIRMEPVFMVLSQSAATAASIAIDDKVSVQQVDYDKLHSRLLKDGQVLEWKGPTKAAPVANDGFVNLLADKDLRDWVIEGAGDPPGKEPNWSLHDGILSCVGQGFGFLRYDKPLSDFVLCLEFKLSTDTNSGVGIRSGKYLPGQLDTRPSIAGYEVQILDDFGDKPSSKSTGSLYRYVAPKVLATRKAGEWNEMEIDCRGTHIHVVLNDQVVQDLDQTTIEQLKSKPLFGFISLQSHNSPVEYRNVRLKTVAEQK